MENPNMAIYNFNRFIKNSQGNGPQNLYKLLLNPPGPAGGNSVKDFNEKARLCPSRAVLLCQVFLSVTRICFKLPIF